MRRDLCPSLLTLIDDKNKIKIKNDTWVRVYILLRYCGVVIVTQVARLLADITTGKIIVFLRVFRYNISRWHQSL